LAQRTPILFLNIIFIYLFLFFTFWQNFAPQKTHYKFYGWWPLQLQTKKTLKESTSQQG
jgi:hypothetical protein